MEEAKLEKGATKSFVKDESLNPYRAYFNNPKPTRRDAEKAFDAVYPYLAHIAKRRCSKYDDSQKEEIVSECYICLWRSIESKKFPLSPGAAYVYMANMLFTRSANFVKKNPSTDGVVEISTDISSKHDIAMTTHLNIYLASFKDKIRVMFMSLLRFKHQKNGYMYILDCMMNGFKIINVKLKNVYNIQDVNFAISYASMLLRRCLYEVIEN